MALGKGREYHRLEIEQKVRDLPWYHSIDLGGGLVTPGVAFLKNLQNQADIVFKDGVEGKSVLDIGCWDGFNSFQAKRRGAAKVVATEHFAWLTNAGAIRHPSI